MVGMGWKVLITDHVWPSIALERGVLEAGGAASVVAAPDGREATLVELARDADAIMTCFAQVTGEVVRAAERCAVIGRFGVGVDNIAVEVATELGIAVTYVPDYCVEEVSDHVMALLLAWNRRIVLFDRSVKERGWGSLPLTMRMMRLRGKTLGIVGFGRIGRAVAAKARAFGLDVLAADPAVSGESVAAMGGRLVGLRELLGASDFVTLHVPLTGATRNLIGAGELAVMKREAFLINAARGGLVDEGALYAALRGGVIAGAGLDVMVDNSPGREHPLLSLDNIIITPHVAFYSQESTLELERRAAEEVVSVMQGRMPNNLVNPAVLDHPSPRHGLVGGSG